MANTTTQKNLKEKLFEFQKLGIVIERNAKGYNYTYASYDHIWKNISEKLNDFKLLVSHKIQDYGGNLFLETTVSDMESGDEQSSQISITANTPQTMWSAITYYKRYNLSAILNLIIEDEDDDGAAAERKANQKKSAPAPQAKPQTPQKKTDFLDENFENFKKWCQDGKTLVERVEKKEEILQKYTVSAEMNKKIDDFLSTL